MDYSESCAYLDSLQMFRIKLGLETMLLLLAGLGHPERGLACIHIAGTNGKGSVGSTLRSLFGAAGWRAGLYSSPHLVSVRERFAIGEELISEAEFAALMTALRREIAAIPAGPEPTWFECATLAAFRWLAEKQVDVAILETGLGGRLDATNVVQPLVSIITDISRDHEAYLGADLKSVAAEKAGIIKPGVPVVCSGRSGDSRAVIEACCTRNASPLYLFGRDFSAAMRPCGLYYRGIHGREFRDLPLVLPGEHQVLNAALALAALELVAGRLPVDEAAIRRGMAAVHWPGRMEYLQARGRRIVLDGAHNEAGVAALCAALEALEAGHRIVLIWGNMADKNMAAARSRLFALAGSIILTRAETLRSARPGELQQELAPAERARTRVVEPVAAALNAALADTGPEDLLCVAGSLYLVGQVRSLLKPGAAV